MDSPLGEIRRESRVSLFERVYQALRRSIVLGVYEPGQRLTEEEVANEAGVSKIPVREAFRLLVSEGLLEYSPNRGVVVVDFGLNEIWDIWRIRAGLEGLAAELSAERISQSEISELARLLCELEVAAAAEDTDRITELLMEFDGVIVASTKSPVLVAMARSLQSITWDMRSYIQTSSMREPVPYLEHRRIYEAICEGDGEKARALTEEHILRWGRVFVDYVGRKGCP